MHRIDAVSKLSGIPVPTLRICQARYKAFSPTTSHGQHRLYIEDDVRKAALLQSLTRQGHGISLVAGLPTAQLQQLLHTRNGSAAARQTVALYRFDRCAKQHSEPGSKPHNKRGAKADEITLTPLELIDRIAKLVPPPRTHRHRYFGVLAPNSPHRAAVVALAQGAAVQTAQPLEVRSEPANTGAAWAHLG